MTIRLPIKYKCQIIEHPDSMEHYMSVRSQHFRFKWMQHRMCMDMDDPDSLEVKIEIPSMEEHEELRNWKDIGYCDMMHFHLLRHLHMRLKVYTETEFFIAARINTNFEFEFTPVRNV